MSTIQDLFQQAQLAEAAYANFTSGLSTINALQDTNNGGSFSPTQATDFVTHWRVVDQYTASGFLGFTDGSGFSATLFQNMDTGQYSFAIRGSTSPKDFSDDTKLIATDGVALSQLVDLYNYWKSLTTSTVTYQAAKLTTQIVETTFLSALYAGVAVGIPSALVTLFGGAGIISSYDMARSVLLSNGYIVEGGTVYKLEFGDSNFVLPGSHISIGLNRLPSNSIVNVDGHSLGGHLAMAFSRLFPGATNTATAVNGLGFKVADANVNNLFSQLGGAPGFDAGKIQNVYGMAGNEFAAMNNGVLQQPGAWDGIYIESAGVGAKLGHGAGQMSDSLAVYNLFATLDPTLKEASKTNLDKITNILKAETGDADHTLEAAVGALGKLFNVADTVYSGNAFGGAGRDKLYKAVDAIEAVLPTDGSLSLITIDAATLLADASALDADGQAYRYALVNLNPFAVLGADYSNFNHNGELDINPRN